MTVISYSVVYFSVATLHLPSPLQYLSLSHPSLVCKQLSRDKVRLKRRKEASLVGPVIAGLLAWRYRVYWWRRNKPDPAGIKTLCKVDRFLNSLACTLIVGHSFLRLFPMLLSYCIEGILLVSLSRSFVCFFLSFSLFILDLTVYGVR